MKVAYDHLSLLFIFLLFVHFFLWHLAALHGDLIVAVDVSSFDLQQKSAVSRGSTWRSNRRRGRSMSRSTKRVWWHLVALHGDLIVAIGVSRSDMRKKEALHPVALHGDQIVVTDVLWFGLYNKC